MIPRLPIIVRTQEMVTADKNYLNRGGDTNIKKRSTTTVLKIQVNTVITTVLCLSWGDECFIKFNEMDG